MFGVALSDRVVDGLAIGEVGVALGELSRAATHRSIVTSGGVPTDQVSVFPAGAMTGSRRVVGSAIPGAAVMPTSVSACW